MPATPRDLLKTHAQRSGEVLTLLGFKAGQANSQHVVYGGLLSVHTTTQQFTIGDTLYVLGQALITKLAQAGIAVAGGATTAAGQFLKVLIELTAAGAVVQTVGAIAGSQAAAVLPSLTPANIAIGWIEVPASFTPGTTALTAPMLKQVTYDAG